MKKSRMETGMELLQKIDGRGGEAVLKLLEDIAPDLGKYIVEFAFGHIYARDGLTLREREMVTLASLLTAGGCEPQLKVHIQGALQVGITPEKSPRFSAVHSLHRISKSPERSLCRKGDFYF